jgi:hypothetical protein
MRNWYWLAALCFVIACSEEKTDLSGNTPLKINDFNKVFKTVTLPINISDTNLAKVRDTIKIGAKALAQFVPDSVVEKIIPEKDQKAILYPLLKIEKETEYYLMLNVHHPKKEEIVVVVFSKKNAYLDYWVHALNEILPEYEIDTPQRVAAFIAQTAHESGNYVFLKENLNYKAASLRKVFPKYFPDDGIAAAVDGRGGGGGDGA